MPKLRLSVGAAVGVPVLLGTIGCAGGPMGLRGSYDEGIVRTGGAEAAATVSLDDRPTKQRQGLLNGRVFGGRNDPKIADDVGIVQTGAAASDAGPIRTAVAAQAGGPKRNFAEIFDMMPKRDGVPTSTARLEDPFLSAGDGPSADAFTTAAPEKPAATSGGPFAADFDAQLAALERSPANADPVRDELEAALSAVREAQSKAVASTPEPASDPFDGQEFGSPAVAEATPAEKTVAAVTANPFGVAEASAEPAGDSGNPFAAFMGGASADQSQSAAQAAEPVVEEPELAAAEPMTIAATPIAEPQITEPAIAADNETNLSDEAGEQEFARERVSRLMDTAELALKAGQLDRATETIESAADHADIADLEFTAGQRSPYSLRRRIEAARRAANAASAVAADDSEPTDFEKPSIVSTGMTASAVQNPTEGVFRTAGLTAPVPPGTAGPQLPPLDDPFGFPAPPADEPFGITQSGSATDDTAPQDALVEMPPLGGDAADAPPLPSLESYDEKLFGTFDEVVAEPSAQPVQTAALEVAPPPPMMLEGDTLAVAPGQSPMWPLLITVALGFIAVFTFRGKSAEVA